MLFLIIIMVVATAVVIGMYQLLIQKYYWGPKGPPGTADKDQDSRPD